VSKAGYDGYRKDVAAAIRMRRQAAKMTQEDLAYEADITARHLHEIEKARTNPTLRTLFKIASALGVKVSAVIQDAEQLPKPTRKSQ
jgi:transcriptional regulator with XRE-family HTH domain